MVKINLGEYESEYKSPCTLYIVLFSVFLTISIGISTFFIDFYLYPKNEAITNFNPSTKAVIY